MKFGSFAEACLYYSLDNQDLPLSEIIEIVTDKIASREIEIERAHASASC